MNAPATGAQIAAALRRSPLYADPSLEDALPVDRRARIVAALRELPHPTYVILVPSVAGGVFAEPRQLANVVHSHLGAQAAYLTLAKHGDGLTGYWLPSDYDDRRGRNATRAANAVGLDPSFRKRPLVDRIDRTVELIRTGKGQEEYDRQSRALRSRAEERSGGARLPGGDGSSLGPALGGAAVVGAAIGGVLLWRHRRLAARDRARNAVGAALMPRAVFETAERASRDELREQASRELITYGELLDSTDLPGTDARVRALLSRALDAYSAAGKVLDDERGTVDLAGVLVLIDQGRDALASASSLDGGGPEIPAEPLCFFNPLHGSATNKLSWRPPGTRRSLHLRACRTCAKAAKNHGTPRALIDDRGERPAPYYEADPADSIWAETGYGQFRDDLVDRVLRGDHAR